MISDSISGVWGGGGGAAKAPISIPPGFAATHKKALKDKKFNSKERFVACGTSEMAWKVHERFFAASSDIKTRGVRTLGKVPAALPEVFVWSWANQ